MIGEEYDERVDGDDEIYAAYLTEMCGDNVPQKPQEPYGSIAWTLHWGLYLAYRKGWESRERLFVSA